MARPKAETLRELFDYDPVTGWLTWKVQAGSRGCPGSRAGVEKETKPGYRLRIVGIRGMKFNEASVVWAWMTGSWTPLEVDHKNCDPTDNRWENLREATRSQQQHNKRMQKNNTVGFKCVEYVKHLGKYRWKMRIGGKQVCGPVVLTPEEAFQGYQDRIKELRGEFANDGLGEVDDGFG